MRDWSVTTRSSRPDQRHRTRRLSKEVEEFSISYMLAGEGEAIGVSNADPFATAPTEDSDWVREGPHLMILVPDSTALDGLSTDPKDSVYVMWKGTPYAHIMVKIAEDHAADGM